MFVIRRNVCHYTPGPCIKKEQKPEILFSFPQMLKPEQSIDEVMLSLVQLLDRKQVNKEGKKEGRKEGRKKFSYFLHLQPLENSIELVPLLPQLLLVTCTNKRRERRIRLPGFPNRYFCGARHSP